MEEFAGPICDVIAKDGNAENIETAYLRQNFLWYKDRDDFDALLLISIPNMKTAMIKNENDLIDFRRSGHAIHLLVLCLHRLVLVENNGHN